MIASKTRVLLVEDDEVDVMAVRRAFRKLSIDNELLVACDGIEALALLRGEQGYDVLHHPFIILLDLNMPRMNGLEFLEELRGDPHFRDVVVFVMSTSKDEKDCAAAYAHNIAGYIVKSDEEQDFLDVIGMLKRYLETVELP